MSRSAAQSAFGAGRHCAAPPSGGRAILPDDHPGGAQPGGGNKAADEEIEDSEDGHQTGQWHHWTWSSGVTRLAMCQLLGNTRLYLGYPRQNRPRPRHRTAPCLPHARGRPRPAPHPRPLTMLAGIASAQITHSSAPQERCRGRCLRLLFRRRTMGLMKTPSSKSPVMRRISRYPATLSSRLFICSGFPSL